MRLNISSFALAAIALVAGNSAAFGPTTFPAQRNHRSSLASFSSYLDGLNDVTPATPTTPESAATVEAATSFSYAPLDYFDVGNMASKGPRAVVDWGTPQDATRKLDDDGTFRVGSWYCSEGGWPSPNPKAVTEVFYMLDGHGCLGDADGTRHYFGPGDTVIIPKGHTGRWDVYTPIRKVWAVNAHERVEETSNPIRAVVEHYHQYTAPSPPFQLPLYGVEDSGTTRTFYDVGPTKVGAWTCEAGSSFPIVDSGRNMRYFFHMLEGVLFVTDGADGTARRCVAGDTVMLPAGFSGHIDVVETAKKVWTDAV